MGEAKRRQAQRETFESVEHRLRELGIDTSSFGFYDSEPYLQVEKDDALFLEQYARWVALRPRDEKYNALVRSVVPRLTALLSAALLSDGMIGGCIAAAGMMSRMLDRLGVWSFPVHGCLTLEVVSERLWRGFAVCDETDFEGGMPGHSWVIAPPYVIVDPSLALQRLDGDRIKQFVSNTLLCEGDFRLTTPDVSDVVSASIRRLHYARQGCYDPRLHDKLQPRLRRFNQEFPAVDVFRDDLQLRYVPTCVRLTDVPLELINSTGKTGRPAIETWRDIIAPAFGVQT